MTSTRVGISIPRAQSKRQPVLKPISTFLTLAQRQYPSAGTTLGLVRLSMNQSENYIHTSRALNQVFIYNHVRDRVPRSVKCRNNLHYRLSHLDAKGRWRAARDLAKPGTWRNRAIQLQRAARRLASICNSCHGVRHPTAFTTIWSDESVYRLLLAALIISDRRENALRKSAFARV